MQKKITVLLLADSPYLGGITSHLISISSFLKENASIRVLLGTLEGKRPDKTLEILCEKHGISLIIFPMNHTLDFGILARLRNFIRRESVDIIHTHGYRAGLIVALLGNAVHHITTCHGQIVNPDFRLRCWQYLWLHQMRRMSTVIACSVFVKQWLTQQHIPENNIQVIYNASKPLAELDTTIPLNLPSDTIKLLFVGRLVKGKGLEVLFQSIQNMANTQLVIVGDGPEYARLKKLSKELAIDVHFAGAKTDTGPWYKQADLLILPSEMEAMPLVLLEAASCSLPVIATRVGGIPEMVLDQTTGILIEPNDIPALRAAIDECRQQSVREKYGSAAYNVWQERFAPARLGNELESLYKTVMLQSTGGRSNKS